MAINVRADIEAAQKKKKKIDVRADIATTAAPKVTTSKKDKSYNGVDAEINRREASRSARYLMQPEVRAAEIKRAEARGDTKRASELKKAKDVEKWADEQVNSDFVRSRAQTVYDNEFNAAKARGDQSPAVAAEHAAQGYLDIFRKKPQKTRDKTYEYRQAEKLQEAANVFGSNDFGKMSESGKAIGANLGGKLPKNEYEKIMAFVNNEPYRDSIEALAIMNHGDSNLAKQISQLTEDEKNIIRYYAARGEKDKVEEFYKLMERELNRRLQTAVNEQTHQEAYDKPILGAAKNVAGTMAAPAAYVANAGNAIANVFRDDYVPTDYNTPAFKGAHMAEQTSAGVTERASDAAGGGAKGEFASLLAGTGLSIANQLVTLPMGATGSLAYMSAEAAGQTTLDALKRGASAEQALILSTAAGAIEAMTEKIPLDNLFKVAGEVGEKGLKNFLKTLVKEAPKQGLTEAGEEIISEIANTIMDIVVMKEKSGYEQYIAELMKDGKSRAEAGKEALIGYVGKNVLMAGAGGFLSGIAMGSGAATVSHARGAMQSRNAGVAEGEAGFTKTEFSDKVSNKTIRALNAIGKALGVNISIGAPTGNAPGAYNGYYQNGNIVIAQDAEDPLKVVLSHEVTHHLQKYNPEAYGKFLEIAVNASEELTGIQKSEMLEGYKAWYSDYTQTDFKYEDTLDEITADFAGRIVDNLDLFRSLVRSDMTVAERFVESVKDFITKVKSTFSKDKSKMDTASLDKYGVRISELEEATKQWSEMLKATKAEVKSGNVQSTVASQMQTADNVASEMSVDDIIDEARGYELDESEAAGESLEDILAEQKNTAETEQGGGVEDSGIMFSKKRIETLTENDVRNLLESSVYGAFANRSYIPLRRNTPQVLINAIKQHSNGSVEVADLPIAMNVEKAVQALEEEAFDEKNRSHGISVDGMIEIIKGMDDPAYIILQKNGRYVEVVKYYDGKSHSAWAVLDFSEFHHEQYLNGYPAGNYNILVTTFDPDDLADYMKTNVEEIVYDKKMKESLQSGSGSLFPSHLNSSPFYNSIPDSTEKSNPQKAEKTTEGNTGSEESDAKKQYSMKKGVAVAEPDEGDSATEPEKSESDEEAFRRAFGDWAYDPEEESYFDETGLADDEADIRYAADNKLDALFEDYAEREKIIKEETEEQEKRRVEETYSSAISDPATEKKKLPTKLKESAEYLHRKVTNSGEAIRKIAKATKDNFLYPIYNRARGATNIVNDMLENKQTNIRGEKVGESLEAILSPIKEKGKEYFRDFHLYLLSKHNVARMSLENTRATAEAKMELDKFIKQNPEVMKYTVLGEDSIREAATRGDVIGFKMRQYLDLLENWRKLNKTRNKPIFFDREETPLSADLSRTKAEELLKKHPEFKEYEAKVRKFIDNVMQYRVDSGLITQEEADYFKKKYPDYIPTYRNTESNLQQLYRKTNIGKTMGVARGSNLKLLPLDIALAEMTKKAVRNGQKNILANRLLDLYDKDHKLFEDYITEVNEGVRDLDEQIDEFGEEDRKFKNSVSFCRDGKLIEMTVTPKLYEAFEEMSKIPDERAPVADWWRKINNAYKKLITTYDPTFIIRNGIKDLQDAIINSRDMAALLKNLPKAYLEIANGGEMFELYKSLGGLHSSRFYEIQKKGIQKKGWASKLPQAIAFGNVVVEQAPRLAEFMSVLEKGDRNDTDVLADALYAAADVTTNFGESGTWGKVLNAYYVPFFNPAIQGAAKIARTITDPKTAKQWYGLAAKCLIMGLGAGFLNDIIVGIFGDDEEKEEYKNLQDRAKDNYFLIPTDDGKFIKIPKGRIAASLGVIADRVRDVAKGEKVSAGEAVVRILENIAPENPITNNIVSPFIDARLFNNESKGRTWYGGDIESDSLQGLPAGERFDSSTDYASKYIGKGLGLSPKKINYILKQYTGGAGRTILPMITPSEQKGDTIAGKIGYGVLGIFTSNFMVDSKLTNKVSGDFYDMVTEAEQKKNSSKGKLADKVMYKHLNRERNQMSGYNKKIREAESDKNLSGKERDVAIRAATAERTAYQKSIIDGADEYRKNVERYLKEYPGKDEEKQIDYAYRKANYATYGAEYAIRASGGKSVYDKALEKVKRGKTTWKEYYEEYFGKDERRYERLRDKYDITYAEYEQIAEVMAKNSTEEEEIEALHKLGFKRSTARGIRRNFNKV